MRGLHSVRAIIYEAGTILVDLALQKVDPQRRAQVRELEEFRRSVTDATDLHKKKSAIRKSCHFGNLPAETASATCIFLLAAANNAQAMILSHVCKEWRTVTLNSPSLWRSATFSPKTVKRAQEWLKRSNGTLWNLQITADFKFREWPGLLSSVQKNFWRDLRSLTLEIPSSSSRSLLPKGAPKSLRLEELKVAFNDDSTKRHPSLTDVLDVIPSTLKILSLHRVLTCFEDVVGCKSLIKVHLFDTMLSSGELTSLTTKNPNLEEVIFGEAKTSLVFFGDPRPQAPFEHLNLRSVRFKDATAHKAFFTTYSHQT